MTELYHQIKNLRIKRGFSLEECACLLDLSKKDLSRFEAGEKSLTEEQVEWLLDLFDADFDQLEDSSHVTTTFWDIRNFPFSKEEYFALRDLRKIICNIRFMDRVLKMDF